MEAETFDMNFNMELGESYCLLVMYNFSYFPLESCITKAPKVSDSKGCEGALPKSPSKQLADKKIVYSYVRPTIPLHLLGCSQ